jgi:carbon-monoxide dehydrogenase iron sulfur subunit
MKAKKYPSIHIDSQKCSGCRLCELVCSTQKSAGVTNPQKSRIRVEVEHRENQNVPQVCQQCDDPPCVTACPVGAISRSGFQGIPVIDRGACTGCEACVQVCPYRVMFFDREEKVALKCDLCGGEPECVKNCLQGAIRFDAKA